MKKSLIYICCTAFLLLEIFCIRGIAMLADYFPLENADAVIFTLTHNMSGAGNFAISIILEILRDSLVIALLIALTIIPFLKLLKTKKKISYTSLIIALNIIGLVLLFSTIYINIPFAKYYQKWSSTSTSSKNTDIYEKEYVDPDSVKIDFKEKRNLILIFLESIEYNFQDSLNGGGLSQNLIPEITEYIKQEQSFIPGGTQIEGSGWTMAEVIVKTCGIPMMLSRHTHDYMTPHGKFFPGVTCLTDILHDNGYTTIISQGSQLSFSKMDAFIRAHSIDEGYGLDEYKRGWHIDENVLNEWGITDSVHYELNKKLISKAATTGNPWAIWFFTINTHAPYAAKDPSCHISQDASKADLVQSSIRCSSKQLNAFIKWAKTQEWYNNTTIAVMGDHQTKGPKHAIGFQDTKQPHYWLDFFINSATTAKTYKRTFSSLDMFPTILEAMGAKIPGRALGLGRSLYSLAPTLLEQYGLDSLNNALEKRSPNYGYFIYKDKKNSPNR